ncbi:MAG: hypothetical protein HYY85_16905 [Deltaproteobacteria bacterium]|nr:hypothetical protein [Deltaproteobacteria bacterium]
MGRAISYLGMIGLAALVGWLAGLDRRQVLAVAIFVGFIAGTLLYWRARLAFALVGVAVLLGAGVLDLPHLIEFAGLDIILFLVGMMLLIGFLEERRFFEVVVEAILRVVGRGPHSLLTALMALAALSAALVDEVTSILFMSGVTLQLTRRFSLSPGPFIIMVVFATNIGSSATVVGNPIGVMIALRAGLTFPDFLRWATPIAAACLLLTLPLCFLYFRQHVAALGEGMAAAGGEAAVEVEPYRRRDLWLSAALFTGTILGLVLHTRIEALLGLEKNAMLLGVALLAAGIVLLLEGERARELVERRVEWWTLTFFLFLFASAGTLRYVGVTGRIAEGLAGLGGGGAGLFLAVTWASGLLSAFMDNVLAVATLIPVIQDLARAGAAVGPLWWGLLFGGTLFGNLTLIGSTANIIAVGILERREKTHLDFMTWFRPGLLVAVPTLLLATVMLILQSP